jgi:FlaA1/EpsC-like NDP-sugar epimerase
VNITQIRPGEKMLESLISETQAQRLVKDTAGYYYIKPSYKTFIGTEPIINYNSKLNPVSKEELAVYLNERNLL